MHTNSLQSNKVPRGDLFSDKCPSRGVLKHVTSRWGVLVILALEEKTYRFSELRKKITGVSEKMLAQTLQGLEHDGLVKRVSYPVVPPHVEYSLTGLGQDFSVKVKDFADWIEANIGDIIEAQIAHSEQS